MTKLKIGALLLSLTILAGCFSFYDSDWQSAKMRLAEQNILLIKTIGIIKGSKKPLIMKGIVLSLGGGIYFALTHVSKIPQYAYYRSFLGIVAAKREITSERHFINGQEVKLIGRYKDISLFKGKAINRFPFIFGDSNQLEIGDKVWVAGYSFLYDKIVKDGIIASIKLNNQKVKILSPLTDMFEITAPINPGDSGSPVFAERLGQYEIIGIVDAKTLGAEGMGYAIKINLVKKAIAKILKQARYKNSGDE